jgi:hypothetical protein
LIVDWLLIGDLGLVIGVLQRFEPVNQQSSLINQQLIDNQRLIIID